MSFMFARIVSVAGTAFLLVCPILATGASNPNSTINGLTMQEVPLKVGEQFLRARSLIIKKGWKPIPMHQGDDYEYSGIEKELAKRKFLEIEGCSVDAGVLCIFYYRKLDKCLRIDTIGENLAQISITRYTEECPRRKH